MTLTADMIPLPPPREGETVAQAQQKLLATLIEGNFETCACCGGYTKVYARKLSAIMMRALVRLSHTPMTPREMSLAAGGGGDAGKLAHWGLAEQRIDRWMITDKGWRFLSGDLLLPHRVLIFQGMVIGFDTSRMIGINDILPGFNIERDATSSEAVRGADVA